MARGQLRIYLGAAPGVGKTYAMLNEGCRRAGRGTDVVVGLVETHGRARTAEQVRDLEVVPRRKLVYRGADFEEMDVDAVLRRAPKVALIDELAHTNVPGSRRAKRWEDVCDLLAAGIAVITTVNVQHLASLNDLVARITGIRQQETVPDWVLELADQVELVDMSPYALRRRMVHGNVYPDPGKAELALQRYFTADNLTALRELALMRVANQVDEEDPVQEVLSFAYQQHVTQILVGESLRPPWQELLRGSFVNQLIRKASHIDIHVLARKER
jgi:two-component system, OmpR family, sensor histidine kinase KdpD